MEKINCLAYIFQFYSAKFRHKSLQKAQCNTLKKFFQSTFIRHAGSTSIEIPSCCNVIVWLNVTILQFLHPVTAEAAIKPLISRVLLYSSITVIILSLEIGNFLLTRKSSAIYFLLIRKSSIHTTIRRKNPYLCNTNKTNRRTWIV